ncbi:MAG: pyridoxal-phosphate dependent enzyme [Gammaproteobacteria bacterium]|nr:pyridoxal-phosphate dependent enzyme [Gammaproteobacteria bacterium]
MSNSLSEADLPTLADVRRAAARIRPFPRRTPVLTASSLDALSGVKLFFKCENFQRVGAFKFRGACNAVQSLSPAEAARGVATHSSGNHGAALALAARLRGARCTVVVPRNAPTVKRAAVAAYGADVVLCEPTLEARERTLAEAVADSGQVVVHPYDDARVIAGQGTAALELVEDVPDLDVVLVPIGGGGLASGTALAVRGISPGPRVVAVEPLGADDAYRSFQAGERLPSVAPDTIADGLLTSLGVRNFELVRRHVDDIVRVSEGAIVRAMRLLWERMKIVVEPSGAVPLAALLDGAVEGLAGQRIGIVLSGGNVDLDRLPW